MKTIIYNIGTLAGILPTEVRKLEGAQMNHVECINNAYLVIEEGIITEFGEMEVSGCGFQNRATPLAAGGGVVLKTTPTDETCAEFSNDPVLDDKVSILDALHMIHLRPFQLPDFSRQDTCQRSDVIYDRLHYGTYVIE